MTETHDHNDPILITQIKDPVIFSSLEPEKRRVAFNNGQGPRNDLRVEHVTVDLAGLDRDVSATCAFRARLFAVDAFTICIMVVATVETLAIHAATTVAIAARDFLGAAALLAVFRFRL